MPDVIIRGLIQLSGQGINSDTPVDTQFAWDQDPDVTGLVGTVPQLGFFTEGVEGAADELIPIGSTTIIDGVEYTMTAVYDSFATYNKTDPETGETFEQEGQTVSFTLEDADGNVLSFSAPSNDFNADDPWAPGVINSITVTTEPTSHGAIGSGSDGISNKLSDDPEPEIPCFVAGTLIDTADGRRPVEELQPGDLVLTRDKGYMPLSWVGTRSFDADAVAAQPQFAAVILRAGSLGPNTPERDTRVSPSHRVLICGARAELLFGENEVLVPALDLVGLPGIERDDAEVCYVHVMFDSHQIVLGDGLWSESFQPAQYSLDGLGAEQRDEIMALFPELAQQGPRGRFRAARMTLRPHEARMLFAA